MAETLRSCIYGFKPKMGLLHLVPTCMTRTARQWLLEHYKSNCMSAHRHLLQEMITLPNLLQSGAATWHPYSSVLIPSLVPAPHSRFDLAECLLEVAAEGGASASASPPALAPPALVLLAAHTP